MPMNEENKTFKPLIVAFCCNWCSYAGADLAGNNRLSLPRGRQDHPRSLLLPCEPDVHPEARSSAARTVSSSADATPETATTHPATTTRDAVWLCSSRCSTTSASSSERTRVEWVSAAEGAKFAATMNDFVEKVTALGENKRLEDLRCRK